jgi:23S rRNA (adenine2503-C2)-methyltransferase
MQDSSQIALLGLDRNELATLVESMGERPFRARQIADSVYRQRVESIEQISTLSQELRAKLAE